MDVSTQQITRNQKMGPTIYDHNYSTGEPHMSFHICCTYPLIYRVQLSIPSCPGNLTNHSPHTMEKEHRKGEETTESAIVLQTLCLCLCYAMLCYAMLCYAMFIEQKSEPGRKRSAATQNLRQKVQNERQEASGDQT